MQIVFEIIISQTMAILFRFVSNLGFEHLNMITILLYVSDHPGVFYYTNQGQDPYIEGVDDAQEFASTREAFTMLGE